jgi:hypothetical protein
MNLPVLFRTRSRQSGDDRRIRRVDALKHGDGMASLAVHVSLSSGRQEPHRFGLTEMGP